MASSSRLKPGEEGSITTKVRTAGRKGRLVKTVRVISNDPEKQRVILVLKAFIKEPVPDSPDATSLPEKDLQ